MKLPEPILDARDELLIKYRIEADDRKTPNIFTANFLEQKPLERYGSELRADVSDMAHGKISQKSLPHFSEFENEGVASAHYLMPRQSPPVSID
jgi:hypothetical protein